MAFDAESPEARANLREKAWEKGLANLSCGKKSVRFRPPLTFSKEDVDKAVGILKECL